MKILEVGWFLIIILAVLQYNFKKERLNTQYLQKYGMTPYGKQNIIRIIYEQDCKKLQPSSEWENLRKFLKSLEKKTSDDERLE